ncbi:hypothetical protein [Streptomyces sp. NPDC021212]|uniref:hypothetical protein n=1 Tax=Streptomyces sp. NPDC021212 TaxID=3365118 RepID=UPI00378AD368
MDLSLWDGSFALLETAAVQDTRVAGLVDAARGRVLTLKHGLGADTAGKVVAVLEDYAGNKATTVLRDN